MDLRGLIQICCGKGQVVSLVGAGGKTTLMYELAEQCSKRGRRVLVSTTTHIAEPKRFFAMSSEDVLRLWEEGAYAVIGQRTPDGKLTMPSAGMLRTCMEKADLTLLEADGSKRLPCKVPGAHEPVILPETSLVIGVMGMSCLGKRMGECCFRMEMAKEHFEAAPDTIMSERMAVSILSSESGTRKAVGERGFIVVLNQCDTEAIRDRAERIAAGLRQNGIKKVVLTCFF